MHPSPFSCASSGRQLLDLSKDVEQKKTLKNNIHG